MELLEKIKRIIEGIGLKKPMINFFYDQQKNVVGYVADETFEGKTDNESQYLLWGALKQYLKPEEFIKIIAVFHETLNERLHRLTGDVIQEKNHSNFWCHQTPELAKYWMFIDVAKIGEEYKSFFLIICEKNNFHTGLTFVYTKEIIEFMELEHNEIYNELYSNALTNGEAEIKMDLMRKYEYLTDKQLYGKANMYWYIYEDFKLKMVPISGLLFTDKEIQLINERIKGLENFKIKVELEDAIKRSIVFNKMKHHIE
jgi:hypothetical protein